MPESVVSRSVDGSEVVVRPVTADDWDDVVAVFSTRGDPARCWCQFFRLRGAQWRQARTASNRAALQREVSACAVGAVGTAAEQALSPGVLAWVGGEPAGWCAIGPRPGYPRLTASPKVRAAGGYRDDPSCWAVTCFVVRTGFRRRGLSAALLDGAVAMVRSGGARTVEAYPVDVAAKAGVSASELYHGVLSTFLAAGFTEVVRTSSSRPIVRLDLARSPGGH